MTAPSTGSPLPFFTRFWFAWACFFRVLFDGVYAARLRAVETPPAELPPSSKAPSPLPARPVAVAKGDGSTTNDAALQLLALLQREGRFVDFLEEDIASFADADIGAAARVVHAGCRKALREHTKLEPVRAEGEGARVTLADDFDPDAVKLTGDVRGSAPYTGTLRHRGWRVASLSLPKSVDGHDARIVAQAEVEL